MSWNVDKMIAPYSDVYTYVGNEVRGCNVSVVDVHDVAIGGYVDVTGAADCNSIVLA